MPIELHEHVYGFIPFLPTNKVRYAYFNYKRWRDTTETNSDITISVTLIHVVGKIIP